MSPFEHVARPMAKAEADLFVRDEYRWAEGEPDSLQGRWEPTGNKSYFLGNFNGWVQYRKIVPGEADILGAREAA